MTGILTGTRADLANGAFGLAYAAGLLAAILARDRTIALAALGLVSCAGVLGWAVLYRRYRLIMDTPSSRVASAAQGYVELSGTSELHPGSPPIGFSGGPPCVWYRYVVRRAGADGGPGRVVSRDQSSDTFVLVDGSGSCVIDPDGAEVFTDRRDHWSSSDYSHTIEYLAPGDPLYALGRLTAVNPNAVVSSTSQDVRDLISEWKRDRHWLLNQFDRNRDGEIDEEEWEAVRKAARRQVEALQRDLASTPEILVLRAPKDRRRPYLLANRDPDLLARYLLRWSWLHLGAALAAALTALRLAH